MPAVPGRQPALAVLGAALLLAFAVPGRHGSGSENLAEQRSALRSEHAARLEELATWCQQQGLFDQAQQTRQWIPKQPPLTLLLFVLPTPSEAARDTSAEPSQETASTDVQQWRQRFEALRTSQAKALFDLARRAVQAGQSSLAYELVVETVREDPQHADGRRILGYQQLEGRWLSAYEVGKVRSKQVWDDRFGWLPRDRLPRYQAGERFYNGRWVSAENEAQLRADVDNGWLVTTEHYTVRTNHSLEEGVRLATQLERLYRIWRQLFVRYHTSEAELKGLFAGGAVERRPLRRFDVTYFRNRDQYVQALKKIQPNIEITTGFYFGDHRTAYFFAPDNEDGHQHDHSNLYHEATHQLFSQARPVAQQPGLEANFWIVEGIACYMESAAVHEDYCTLGGTGAVRLGDAHFRLLDDDFYVPLDKFVSYGMETLQRDPQIAMLYSQAAGLTHFLVHDGGGRYRDALVDYLLAIYTARDRTATLAELTGTGYPELDRQYREFLEGLKIQSAP